MAPKSQAGQKRSSEGADIRNYFTLSAGQAQPESDSEPALKRAKTEASTTESLNESNEEDAPPVAQAGWNNSVGTGLRTSFGTKLKLEKPRPDADSPSAEPQVDSTLGDKQSPEEGLCKDDSSKEDSSKEESPGSNESIILGGWIIPNLSALSAKVVKKTEFKKGDTWEARLGEWYSAVAASNPGKEGLKEPAVFLDIWSQWLKQQGPMPPTLRGQGLKFTTVESLGAKRINAMMKKSEKNSSGPTLPPHETSKSTPPPEKTSPSWTMPPLIDAANLELPYTEEAAWTRRFVSWLHEFAKLNPDTVPITRHTESCISDFYKDWLENYHLNRKTSRSAVKMSKMAFNRQRERLHKILAGVENSKTAPETTEQAAVLSSAPAPQSTEEGTVLSSTTAPQSTEEVAAQFSSTSEGEIREDDDDASTAPSPRNKDVPNGTANTERLPPGPVLFNWSMTADSSSGINGASQIPELPVIPLVAEPIKLMSAQEELEYRANYYPGVLPDEVFCLYCANHGHATRECPLLTCRWCGVWGHPYLRCPTRHRCTKCRQLGHEGKGCTEKLALTRDEMDCARCGAKDHLENRCYEMFRSTFNPPPERIRKVKALPISCAQCGEEGHYWTECGLNAGWITEADKAGLSSATTRKFYLDPDCDNVAICYANTTGYQIRGAAAANGGRPAHLNGKSIAPKRHVEYYEEDDDDDEHEQFIRPPPQKRNQPGKITFSSFSSSNNRGRGGGGGGQSRGGGGRFNNGYNNNGNGGRSNPPLPSGPPPSGPRAGSRRGRGGGGGGGGRRGGRGGY